jgi:SulP family sulfate permease
MEPSTLIQAIKSIDWKEFTPKLFSCLAQGYSLKDFKGDFSAGLNVSIVSMPLAMALAVASGADPEHGLFTAIIAGLIISILGGSRTQIGGPTAAFVVVIYNIIQQYGYDGLVLATLLAGVMLIIAGFARLGSIVRYVPYAVITGFTTGLAVVLFIAQFKDLFGLDIVKVSANFFERMDTYAHFWHTWRLEDTVLGMSTVVSILFIRKHLPKIPVLFVILSITGLLAWGFDISVATIESKFNRIPSSLPMPHMPHFSWDLLISVFPSACVVAFLAGIESLLCAVIADGMTGDRHRPNMELIAQGIANVAASSVGGLPATAAFSRTATNIKAGARTPLSGVIQSLLILCFIAFFGPFSGKIPLCALAAILLVVAVDMSAYGKFYRMLKAPLGDRIILLTTFFLTVCFNLSVAIQGGIILSALIFMRRMSLVTQISADTNTVSREDERGNTLNLPENTKVYHVNGPFFFGAASRLQAALEKTSKQTRIYILNLSNMPLIDTTGAQVLKHFIERCYRKERVIILAGIDAHAHDVLKRCGIYQTHPKKYFTRTLAQGIALSHTLSHND